MNACMHSSTSSSRAVRDMILRLRPPPPISSRAGSAGVCSCCARTQGCQKVATADIHLPGCCYCFCCWPQSTNNSAGHLGPWGVEQVVLESRVKQEELQIVSSARNGRHRQTRRSWTIVCKYSTRLRVRYKDIISESSIIRYHRIRTYSHCALAFTLAQFRPRARDLVNERYLHTYSLYSMRGAVH